MSSRYKGGVISATAPVTTTSTGIWTLAQQMQAVGGSVWPTKPDAPTIGTATAGNANASVTFTAPAYAGYPATITGYTVTSSPGGLTGTGASSPITVSGLTNGTPYTFTVTATNATGTGPASAASNSATPIPPQQVAYTTAGTYTWVAPSGLSPATVSVVCVGAGGGPICISANSVSPGQNGGDSYFISTGTVKGGGGEGAPGPAVSTAGTGTIPNGGTYTGDGGGNGGQGGNITNCSGGAGGYSGNGGRGSYSGGNNATSGNGGAGAGGYNYATGSSVGLLGAGANGTPNSVANPLGGAYNVSSGGSGGADGNAYPLNPMVGPMGAGGAGQFNAGVGGAGGGLGYKNSISVTSGGSYTVVVGAGGAPDPGNASSGAGGAGAVRIIWSVNGTTRAFPSTNTGDL